MEPADPPRKNYDLKAREFVRLNARPGDTTGKSTGHDVYAMLQHNRTVEKQAGCDHVEIMAVKSRRKRDYWWSLIGGNGFIVGLVALARFNLVSLIFGLAGVVVFSLSLTWILWFLLDDY
jgi:hypothetical protein